MNASEQGDNMSKGTRYNEGKTQLSMILEARNALNGCAKVLEFGKAKYDRGNWRNGLNHTETCDSLLRHLSAYLSGEDLDPESELPHVDHVLCNALFLAEMLRTHSELDDRSKLNNEDNKESNLDYNYYKPDGTILSGLEWRAVARKRAASGAKFEFLGCTGDWVTKHPNSDFSAGTEYREIE